MTLQLGGQVADAVAVVQLFHDGGLDDGGALPDPDRDTGVVGPVRGQLLLLLLLVAIRGLRRGCRCRVPVPPPQTKGDGQATTGNSTEIETGKKQKNHSNSMRQPHSNNNNKNMRQHGDITRQQEHETTKEATKGNKRQ